MDKHDDEEICEKCGGPLQFRRESKPALIKEGDIGFITGRRMGDKYCPKCDKNPETHPRLF